MADDVINGVYVSASGTDIYVATQPFNQNGGLSVSTTGGGAWTNYTTANGLGSNTVYGVYASGGNIYAATAGGLSIFSGGVWTNITTTTLGFGSNTVYGVYVSGGVIYAATAGGLSVYSGGAWTNYTIANGLGSNIVYGVYVAGGVIYAATAGGLSTNTTPPIVGLFINNLNPLHLIVDNFMGCM